MIDYVQKAVAGLLQVQQELEGQNKSIYDALAALGHGTAKPKSKRASKPCCKKEEVITVLAGLLRDNRSLSRTELEELAKDKLSKELGKNLSGFAMRFKEALADPLFVEYETNQFRLSRDDARSGEGL